MNKSDSYYNTKISLCQHRIFQKIIRSASAESGGFGWASGICGKGGTPVALNPSFYRVASSQFRVVRITRITRRGKPIADTYSGTDSVQFETEGNMAG